MNRTQLSQALRISSLLVKLLRDDLSQQERQELDAWLKADVQNRSLIRKILDHKNRKEALTQMEKFDSEQAYDRLLTKIRQADHQDKSLRQPFSIYYKLTAAAVLLVIFAAGLLLLRSKPDQQSVERSIAAKKVETTQTGILLTLADGRKVDLEAQNKGIIAKQGQAVITKQNGDVLSYKMGQEALKNTVASEKNQLAIPRGKQYQVILPDGSKVWLNAQSVLTFPTQFQTKERFVELTGEAYFEIAHHSAWPFRVKTNGQTVEVLGTHFNVNAYPENNQTITTLASGKVKVYDGADAQLLKPGQMALKSSGRKGFEVATADLDETLAWKAGLLVFKDQTIEDLMQMISRTYDVDFEIDDRVRGQHFGGSHRIKNGLTNLLRNLEQTNVVHFKLEERRIRVMP